jgi:hypothetical protein
VRAALELLAAHPEVVAFHVAVSQTGHRSLLAVRERGRRRMVAALGMSHERLVGTDAPPMHFELMQGAITAEVGRMARGGVLAQGVDVAHVERVLVAARVFDAET